MKGVFPLEYMMAYCFDLPPLTDVPKPPPIPIVSLHSWWQGAALGRRKVHKLLRGRTPPDHVIVYPSNVL